MDVFRNQLMEAPPRRTFTGDSTGLVVAANNGSDFADAATLRENIGLGPTDAVQFNTASIGGSYIGGGALVVESTITNNTNIDGQILNLYHERTSNGASDNYGLSVQVTPTVSSGVTDSGTVTAITGDTYGRDASLAGNTANFVGGRFRAGIVDATSGATVTNAVGLLSGIRMEKAGTTITSGIGHKIESTVSAGTVTNLYDLYAATPTANNYLAGKVGIGVEIPSVELEVGGDIVADSISVSGAVTGTGSSTNNLGGNLIVGSAKAAGDVEVAVGGGRSADGNAFVDIIGDTTYTDYGLRVIRNSGANGGSAIASRGTGTFRISTVEAGAFAIGTNSVDRFIITAAGALELSGTVIHSTSATPASASAAGVAGTIAWDSNYIYVCVATNTWKRTALSTW